MIKQKQIIERLRRRFYIRDNFLINISKRLDMFTFLNKKERIRAIYYLRKEIKKELEI